MSGIPTAVFLDTNFFARLILGDVPEQVRLAQSVMDEIQARSMVAETSETVIFELVYVLNKTSRIPKPMVVAGIRPFFDLPGIAIPNRLQLLQALHLWEATGALSFADAFHLALTAATEHRRIFSFDKALSNRIEGVVRVESVAELTAAPRSGTVHGRPGFTHPPDLPHD